MAFYGLVKAVVFHARNDVRVQDIPVPACGEEQIRVAVEACAVCSSDLKAYQSGNPRLKPPITMGHEFTGRVDAVGAKVGRFAVGERVVMATSISCGQCYYCRRNWNNLCLSLDPMGFSYPGGMAEYVVIPAIAIRNGHVVKVPDTLQPEYAALAEPVSCAVNCAENCGIQPGDTVVVVGAGPMGIMNLQVAREFGAGKVILAQRAGKRLEQARRFACDRLVDSSNEDLASIVSAETDGRGADCVIVAAPSAAAQEQALGLVRKKGCVCLFASLPVGASLLSLDSRKIHYGELRLVGASDSTARQVERALDILQRPDFPRKELVSHILPLEQISRAFELMLAREAMRVVLRP